MAGLFGPEDEFEAAKEEEQPSEPPAAEVPEVTLMQQVKAVASDRMWWIIMIFYLLFQWSGALKNGTMTYYCKWVVDNTFLGSAGAWGASQSLLTMMGALPMTAASALLLPLSNKYGKRRVCGICLLAGAVGGVIAGLGQGRLIPVAVGVALKCFGAAPTCNLIVAMVADVIDHVEYRTGIRTDGFTMSVYSSLAVASAPVANAAFSAALAHAGYDQHASAALGTAAQSAAVRQVISVGYIWTETVCYAVAGILLLGFWTVEKNLAKEREMFTEQ